MRARHDGAARAATSSVCIGPVLSSSMTTFIGPDDTIDFAKSSRQRSQDHVACFLHLRDLVYLHPEAASASAVSVVQTLEARVIAAKAAREKGSGETRAREAGRRDMADRRAT